MAVAVEIGAEDLVEVQVHRVATVPVIMIKDIVTEEKIVMIEDTKRAHQIIIVVEEEIDQNQS